MKKHFFSIFLGLLLFTCASDDNETNEEETLFLNSELNFDFTPEDGACYTDGFTGETICSDYICLQWWELDGADGYKVYYSESIGGNYTQIETIQEQEYQSKYSFNNYSDQYFEYNISYFFYVVPFSNIYGDGLASEIFELQRCQSYTELEIITDIPFEYDYLNGYPPIISSDIYNDKGFYMLSSMYNLDPELFIIDINTGNIITTFNSNLFVNPRQVEVDSNEDIHVLDNDNKRIRKFNFQTQAVYSQSIETTEPIIDIDIDKVQNRLFLVKAATPLTIDVYDINYNALSIITLGSNYTNIVKIVYGQNNMLYVQARDSFNDKYLLVYSTNGVLLNELGPYSNMVLDKIYEVDSDGSLYSYVFFEKLKKLKIDGNEIKEVTEFQVQLAVYDVNILQVNIDINENVYLQNNFTLTVSNTFRIRKLQAEQ